MGFKIFSDALQYDERSEGKAPGIDSFRETHVIRNNPSVRCSEPLPSVHKSRHDLIDYEKHAILVAYLPDLLRDRTEISR